MSAKFFTKYKALPTGGRSYKREDWVRYWESLTPSERLNLHLRSDLEQRSLSAIAIEWGALPQSDTENPPANGTDTSQAAAKSIAADAASLRDRVYDAIRKSDNGLTTDEIEQLMGLNHQTASPRVWELHRRSLIGDSGQRRKTRSNRLAIVYRVLTADEVAKVTKNEAKRGRRQLEFPFAKRAAK